MLIFCDSNQYKRKIKYFGPNRNFILTPIDSLDTFLDQKVGVLGSAKNQILTLACNKEISYFFILAFNAELQMGLHFGSFVQ